MARAMLLVVACVALAPAALLDRPLADGTEDRLHLVDADGYWWRGRGIVATRDGRARLPVSWRVQSLSAAGVELMLRVGDDDAAEPGARLMVTRDHVGIRDLRARLPAAFIAAVDPRLQSIALGGRIAVDAPTLAFAPRSLRGEFRATWTNAHVVVGGTVIDLGTVSLATTAPAPSTTATLSNTGGDAAVAGTLVERNGNVDGTIDVRPDADAAPAVRNTLSMLGAPDAGGVLHVRWRGAP